MIHFNHDANTFQDSIVCEGKSFNEHFHVNPDFMLDDTMDKVGEKLDKTSVNLVETVKAIDEEAKNLSLFITCCYLFAKTVIRCNGIIKIAVAQKMIPAMKGEKSLSHIIEGFYEAIAKDFAAKEDERIIIGLTAFHAGFMGAILREYEEFQSEMMRPKPDQGLTSLLTALKQLSNALKEDLEAAKKSDIPPPIEKLKDLDNPEKKN